MKLNKATCFVLAVFLLTAIDFASCSRNGEWIKSLFDDDDDDGEEEGDTSLEGATAGSRVELQGWFKIFVVGTGEACFTKDYQVGISEAEQFGNNTSAEAFIQFFGEPECEFGDWGLAYGKIRASVVAAAYQRGAECLATVISAVINDPFHRFSKGDVDVHISGEAVGEAVALCEQDEKNEHSFIV